MLDADTKHRIDAARNILVGKVPDPKSQVEQITIALIYKFMDDMDAESELLGGVRSFFVGKYEQYGWAKLMNSGLGGNEILNRYAEAMTELPRHQGLPQLFRDIFKNAYLPYRDPETLKLFLKQIDGFTYDHSERLGDAFEYLLSVLGTQGDAGQFRTPRHMIDFMVALLNPQKHESVLDPACGTAGFLIAAYKHIAAANRDAQGDSTLSQLDRVKLAKNFVGYDISPDMVRLSRVNLYLHGFATPQIDEYDTLTQLDHWGKTVDVVLANPPFMSPKGGIQTHSKFSVQSKRSEVLFVDYMAEHLSPRGRAAIIVPEGIIFQSGSAYKQLRKMLVEQYLVAVISLPAGLFQPYSGVKTSILVLDRALAPTAKQVAFFTITNDGFALNAQRRPIAANDLPQVLADCTAWMQGLAAGNPISTVSSVPTTVHPESISPVRPEPVEGLAVKGQGLRRAQSERMVAVSMPLHLVDKTKFAASGDYNLSGERYREGLSRLSEWNRVRISDVCNSSSGGTPKSGEASYYENGTIPWIRSGEVKQGFIYQAEIKITELGLRASSAKIFSTDTVLIAMYGANVGDVGLLKIDACTNQAVCGLSPKDPETLNPHYLYLILKNQRNNFARLAGGGAQPNISQSIVKDFEIPLPPLAIQQAIVAEIERYQTIIDGARAVVDNYQPQIDIDPSWTFFSVMDVCDINPRKSEINALGAETSVSFVPMSDLNENNQHFDPLQSKLLSEVGASYTYFRNDDVLIAKVTPCFENGKAGIAKNLQNSIGFGSSELYVMRCKVSVLPEWIYHFLTTKQFRDEAKVQMTGTGGLQRVPKAVVENYKIPLPPLAIQQAIVAQIQAEQALVNANRELITRFEAKIAATLARVWGDV